MRISSSLRITMLCCVLVMNCGGCLQIWRVEEGEKVAVEQSSYGQFFGGDCYLILYSYSLGGRRQHIIYIW